MTYRADGSLVDDTGHIWWRIRDWLEPTEAAELVAGGSRYLIQFCQSAPRRGRTKRFTRDVLSAMLISEAAARFDSAGTVPTVMVAELWRSSHHGDCVLVVERGPYRRSADELQNDC